MNSRKEFIMSKPLVAVVGRPNVGKSTFFNRVVGRRVSIVEDTPGVTRDRIYAEAEWSGVHFALIDTGGIEPDSKDIILSQMREQAQMAMDTSDVILFMCDGKEGVTAADREVASMLMKTGKDVVLAVNKVDNRTLPDDFYDFYELGLGEPIPISSANMLNLGDLLDRIIGSFPEGAGEEEEDTIKIAMIGKPNVGKSSLINKLIGENRVIVSPIAGTTRDSIDTPFEKDGEKYLLVKGAPEIVLDLCEMEERYRNQALRELDEWQHKAMRTLAFAYKRIDSGEAASEKSVPTIGQLLSAKDFTLQALVAITDPIRKDVPAAVKECRHAGIEVKVVTGDTAATAMEIGKQIGVFEDEAENIGADGDMTSLDQQMITGEQWEALSDEEAYKRAKDIRVMSRARPTDKQRLVAMLQKHGEVVAVTGDGTNDAPALHYAHVGLSLGSGTSVAKEASDMTLLDDSFKSIANAVMWGRSLYRNLQRFLFFQLVVNVAALLLVLGGSIIGTEMPLTVTQILWVNLIMDTFAALALASLPPSHEVMNDKPRKATDFIINKGMAFGILFCGIAFFIVMFAMLIYCERRGKGGVDVHELTVFFTTFVMIQFWNLFNAKSLGSNRTAFRHFLKDKGMILVLALVLVGQWLIVTFGGEMFRTVPLSLTEWLVIIGATSIVLWVGEIWRAFKRLLVKRKN